MKELIVDHNYPTSKAINKLHKLRGRTLIVVKNKYFFKGILSYYDIRKSILNNSITKKTINQIYNKKSQFIYKENLNEKIKKLKNQIKELAIIPVIDKKTKKLVDILDFKKIINLSNKNQKKINCDVVIMAGGKGTRLKPYTEVLPKPMLPIRNKPIIKHIVEKFEKFAPKSFYITLNYKSKLLNTYINELKTETDTVIKTITEKVPLGTFGGITLLKHKLNNNFILTNCDTIIDYNYYEILSSHLKKKNDITIVTAKKNFTIPYGLCEVNNRGFIFKEKPKYKLNVNTGFYIIKKPCLNLIKKKGYLDFNEFLEICIKKKKKINFFQINSNDWIDVGQKEKYQSSIKKKF